MYSILGNAYQTVPVSVDVSMSGLATASQLDEVARSQDEMTERQDKADLAMQVLTYEQKQIKVEVDLLSLEQRRLDMATKTLIETMVDNPVLRMLASIGEESAADKAKVKSLAVEVESLSTQLAEAKVNHATRELKLLSQVQELQREVDEKNKAIDSILARANEFMSVVSSSVRHPTREEVVSVAATATAPLPQTATSSTGTPAATPAAATASSSPLQRPVPLPQKAESVVTFNNPNYTVTLPTNSSISLNGMTVTARVGDATQYIV